MRLSKTMLHPYSKNRFVDHAHSSYAFRYAQAAEAGTLLYRGLCKFSRGNLPDLPAFFYHKI